VNRQLSPGNLKGEGKGVASQLIDIGQNLTHRSFQSDREAVIRRAVAAGVVRLINTGTTLKGSQDGLALARAHPGTVLILARHAVRSA
jgi:TatD DNase family protein